MVIVDDDSKDAAPVRRDGAEELDAEEGREDGEDDPARYAAEAQLQALRCPRRSKMSS